MFRYNRASAASHNRIERMSQQPAAPTQEPERHLKSFRESKARFGFWWRAILTLSIWYWTVYRHNKIDLTTRRVVQQRGNWLSQNETSVLIGNVTDVTLNRSFMGKLSNYGDISISSAGSSGAEINATGLAGADELRSAIFDLRDGKLDETKL
jgi:membrane protein YdbS with pleckstrin-like domain